MEIENKNLWDFNTPAHFWLCEPNPSEELWEDAIRRALPRLGLQDENCDINSLPALTLGEGRFGLNHWELGPLKRVYYLLKSIIPRSLSHQLRQFYHRGVERGDGWPIEHRYVNYLWEVLRQTLILGEKKEVTIRSFWPGDSRFAFVLTHDIETAEGQEFVEVVANLEESLGFRSSFNFVPERYPLKQELMKSLRQREFEVGIHGLKHNGRLFDSKASFLKNAKRINRYLKEWNAEGFRAELMLRNPEWLQALDVEYDLSFFDTDPFEPIPGGAMSIWPFFVGHFVELPYTLVQDYTLTDILKEDTPRLWLEKVEFIRQHCGMALVNSHPDYLRVASRFNVYSRFLDLMREKEDYWSALPCEVARWWKHRSTSEYLSTISLDDGRICISPQKSSRGAVSCPFGPGQVAGS